MRQQPGWFSRWGPRPDAAPGEKAVVAGLDSLRPGDDVEAIGLTEEGLKDLNGKIGVLVKRHAKKTSIPAAFRKPGDAALVGRLEVRFMENDQPKIVALAPENSCVPGGVESQKEKIRKEANENKEKSTRGKYVEVSGLESEKGKLLNGQRGIVIKKVDATGRIEVSLGADGTLTSLKPECLNLVTGAPTSELEGAREKASPHMKAADEETAVQEAASAAALQAASVAASRGMTGAAAEAYGGAAAERTLLYAKEVAKAQAAAAKAQTPATARRRTGWDPCSAAPGMVPGFPGMAPTTSLPVPRAPVREAPKSVETCQIGDTLEACGLRGGDLGGLNGDKGSVTNILGWSEKRRYVMRFKQFIIDDSGDLAEKERTVTLTGENLRLPGSGPADEGLDDDLGDSDSDDKKRSRSRGQSRRSRSRRR